MPYLCLNRPLKHRVFYPGEIELGLSLGGNPTHGIPILPTGVTISLMWENSNQEQLQAYAAANPGFTEPPELPYGPEHCETEGHSMYVQFGELWYPCSELPEPPFNVMQVGNLELIAGKTDGEPYAIEMHAPGDDHISAAWIAMQQDELARLLGPELAYEVCRYAIMLLEAWYAERTEELVLRFTDMDAFHQVTMQLCEIVGRETGAGFNLAAKLQEYQTFWFGGDSVPGQLSWYAANGPTQPGETTADYEAEVADFHALVYAGQQSIGRIIARL